MKRLRSRTLVMLAVLCFGITAPVVVTNFHPHSAVQAFSARNLALGSEGYDVHELQNRLKFLGFYRGKVDGHFGWRTYWAVRNFQDKYGMNPTGFVDMKTKMHLTKASAGWRYHPAATGRQSAGSSPRAASPRQKMPTVPGLSQSDVNLMAHVVYGEARGEPYDGEVAIAAVIVNRLRDPRFPHSVPAIVYQPGAFTAVADGQVNLQPDSKAMKAVEQAIHGWDPSHGAVYYFNPATATSRWIWSRPSITKIGKHIFCR